MDPTLLALIVLVFGLAAGAAFGWFFGSRPVADWRARFEVRDGEARAMNATEVYDLLASAEGEPRRR